MSGANESPRTDLLAQRLQDDDPFRVAIRGHVVLEDIVDEALREMLTGHGSADVMGLQFSRRLALATSLGLITENDRRLVHELGRIRNDFAHGTIEELSLPRAKQLLAPLRAIYPEPAAGRPGVLAEVGATPHRILTSSLMGAFVAINWSIDRARAERSEREQALVEKRQQSPIALTLADLFRQSQSRAESDSPTSDG